MVRLVDYSSSEWTSSLIIFLFVLASPNARNDCKNAGSNEKSATVTPTVSYFILKFSPIKNIADQLDQFRIPEMVLFGVVLGGISTDFKYLRSIENIISIICCTYGMIEQCISHAKNNV